MMQIDNTVSLRIRPHNDNPELAVLEFRTYNGNAEKLGDLIKDFVVTEQQFKNIFEASLKD